MARSARPHPYKLYGALMLAVIAALVTLSILLFQQAFRSVVPVTLRVERSGLQLLPGSDVKVRGVIVGDVQSITSDGNGAIVALQLDPSKVGAIPSNVSARLLPKTIFGEKYVDLVLPPAPAARHIEAGDVIGQDRSKPALEIDQALNDVLPLLRTVQPAELNATLTAIADALTGRGGELGATIVQADAYLARLNRHLPTLKHDLGALANVAATYDAAAPDLLRLARNAVVTADTVVAKQQTLAAFLHDVAGAADSTRELLARNATNIVQVNAVNRNLLGLLQKYSPEYTCFFQGVAKLIPDVRSAVGKTPQTKHSSHIVLEFTPPEPGYANPLDLPEYGDRRGPNCYGLPNPPATIGRIQFKDGTEDDPRFGGKAPGGLLPSIENLIPPAGSTGNASFTSPSMGGAGTAQEQDALGALLGPMLGVRANAVPAVADLLYGPLARGMAVTVR